MKPLSRLALVTPLMALAAGPAAAQVQDHSHRWYWGAQAGGMLYQTNAQGYAFDPVIGVHWLITGKRSALYIGGEQAFFTTTALATVVDPNSATGLRDATFSQVRRLFFGLLAFPLPGRIEPYAGGGFAIVNVLDASVDCSGTTPNSQCVTLNDQTSAQSAVDDAGSKAFGWIMGGLQITSGKLALYGQYTLTGSAQGFLISGSSHTIQGGVRYSFGTAKEDVTAEH